LKRKTFFLRWPVATSGLLPQGTNTSVCYRRQDCVKFCLALNSCQSKAQRAVWISGHNVSTVPFSNLQICRDRGKDVFLYSKTSRFAMKQIQPYIQWVPRSFLGVKQPGREDGKSYPSRSRMCEGIFLICLYVSVGCTGTV
jgi:hypothetical protein